MLILVARKIKDMNYSSHKEGAVISATEFHPTSMVGLVAGNKVDWLTSYQYILLSSYPNQFPVSRVT